MTIKKSSMPMLLLAVTVLPACFGSDDKSASSGASGVEACLERAKQSACELVGSVVLADFVPADAEVEKQPSTGPGDCTMAWHAGRQQTMTIAGNSFTGPVNDELTLDGIRKISDDAKVAEKRFATQYRTPNQEQKERMAAAAQESVQKNTDAAHQDMGKELANRFVSALEYQTVTDVGDAAAWGGAGLFKQLYVRVGRYVFQTRLTRSEDETQIIQDSAALARSVIKACS